MDGASKSAYVHGKVDSYNGNRRKVSLMSNLNGKEMAKSE